MNPHIYGGSDVRAGACQNRVMLDVRIWRVKGKENPPPGIFLNKSADERPIVWS